MKKIRRITLTGILIGIVLTVVQLIINYLRGYEMSFDMGLLIMLWTFLLYSVPLTFVNVYFFNYLDKEVGWIEKPIYRFIVGVMGSAALTVLAILIIRFGQEVIIGDIQYQDFLSGESLGFYAISVILSLLIGLIFHAIYYYKELQKSKVTEQKVIAGTASAKFDALKNQLDPHFLFNSLNVLSSLIEENPTNAQEFTTALSKIYRYVLEQKDKQLVTVDEELQFAKTYMSLLKMRFEDSIVFEVPEKAINPQSKVVPLSLQLLLENAVKHNVVTSMRPLTISIFEDKGHLVVKNNLQAKQFLNKNTGVGLSNIRQRYSLLTNRKVNINQSESEFVIALPMLTKQITTMKRIETRNLDSEYMRAKKHVEEIKEFYFNLLSYCLVIPFLIFIWWFRTPDVFQWFWFPVIGWGIGLSFHGYKVFVNDGILGNSWEQRKIEQFMREEDERNTFKND